MKYIIYCDGSTRGNGQENSVGAWAYAIINPETNTMSYADVIAVKNTTNQRMELTAAIQAIKKVCEYLTPFDRVEIYTDSAYLHNCYTQKWYRNWQMNGWRTASKKPVQNIELWQELISLLSRHSVTWHKVKGHADNEYNNRCDRLAVKCLAHGKLRNDNKNQ